MSQNGDETRRSRARRALRHFLREHWRAILRGSLLGLVLILVLQNIEPTRIDLLFWSLPEVPKLVVILASLVVGALLWESLRRSIARGG
jgi:uncharacterized integral membrane protein